MVSQTEIDYKKKYSQFKAGFLILFIAICFMMALTGYIIGVKDAQVKEVLEANKLVLSTASTITGEFTNCKKDRVELTDYVRELTLNNTLLQIDLNKCAYSFQINPPCKT